MILNQLLDDDFLEEFIAYIIDSDPSLSRLAGALRNRLRSDVHDIKDLIAIINCGVSSLSGIIDGMDNKRLIISLIPPFIIRKMIQNSSISFNGKIDECKAKEDEKHALFIRNIEELHKIGDIHDQSKGMIQKIIEFNMNIRQLKDEEIIQEEHVNRLRAELYEKERNLQKIREDLEKTHMILCQMETEASKMDADKQKQLQIIGDAFVEGQSLYHQREEMNSEMREIMAELRYALEVLQTEDSKQESEQSCIKSQEALSVPKLFEGIEELNARIIEDIEKSLPKDSLRSLLRDKVADLFNEINTAMAAMQDRKKHLFEVEVSHLKEQANEIQWERYEKARENECVRSILNQEWWNTEERKMRPISLYLRAKMQTNSEVRNRFQELEEIWQNGQTR